MGEQSHSQGLFHTEEGDVSYWAHCVAFYEFWERENSLEIKVRCWIATIEVTACAVRGLM